MSLLAGRLTNVKDYLNSWDFSETVSATDVAELMNGAIDTHIHAFPDIRIRCSIIDICKRASESNIGALVWKDHFVPTGGQSWILQQFLNEWAVERGLRPVQLYGGIVLNFEVGGLNPKAVEVAVRYPHSKVIWMPTFASPNYHGTLNPEGLTAITDKDELKPEMKQIIDIISKARVRAHNKVYLAVGHMPKQDTFRLVEGCKEAGAAIQVEHVSLSRDPSYTMDELKSYVDLGAYIGVGQHATAFCKEQVQIINEIGAEHCVLCCDKGQIESVPVDTHLKFVLRGLLARGISKKDIKIIAKENAENLLGIKV